jgi:hypothetical protein
MFTKKSEIFMIYRRHAISFVKIRNEKFHSFIVVK